MKRFNFFTFLLMVLMTAKVAAQNTITGLYLTLNDYNSHKLSFATNGNDGNTLALHSPFVSTKITVAQNGRKQTLLKSEVFGYSEDNQDYRFYNNRAYRILEAKSICIYKYTTLVPAGKGMKPVELFYFSDALNSEVKPLTIANIETVYAKNVKFRYRIEQEFKTDEQLTAYYPSVKEFKIKYLYDESTK